MSNPDWYYDQGSPDPDEEEPDICSSCGYYPCACDMMYDDWRDNQ